VQPLRHAGIYNINQTINVTNPNTVALDIGMPTLIPIGGVNTMRVADVEGPDRRPTASSGLLPAGAAVIRLS
jgi:hypothetical protein